MEGSNPERVARLIKHLIKCPEDIVPYFLTGPFSGKTPLDLGLPWFAWGAVRFLDIYVQPGMQVFEWGSGGSTLFFARHGCQVFSVEDNADWFDKVMASSISYDGQRAIELVPYDFQRATDFKKSDYLNTTYDLSAADIIVVDGTEGAVKVRPNCFERAQSALSSGIIVVDDSWRYPEILEATTAKKVHRFSGTGPCRPGVTSTDIHFY